VLIRRVDPSWPLPVYAHPGDAGMDLCAAEAAVVPPAGGRVTVPTGVALALPQGMVALVHARSGLAARHGVTVLNSPGVVDAGYRGEIEVTLLNTDPSEPFTVSRGDRIAQLVFQRFVQADLVEVTSLPGSARGARGFGSTGVAPRDAQQARRR
jgi:dUTP pyrophosphatase